MCSNTTRIFIVVKYTLYLQEWLYIYIHTYIFVYMYVCMYVCVYVCVVHTLHCVFNDAGIGRNTSTYVQSLASYTTRARLLENRSSFYMQVHTRICPTEKNYFMLTFPNLAHIAEHDSNQARRTTNIPDKLSID